MTATQRSTTNQNQTLATKLWTSYSKSTPQSLKLIDAYLAFIMFSGIIQFVYLVLGGSFPYNAFLAGFISSVGSFVLTVNLRIQSNPENKEFGEISPVRAFADFAFGSILLHFFVANFLG